MRLDKYLKVSRLIKRRSLAKEAERILVNGVVAKPSYELKGGDTLTLTYMHKLLEIKVASLIDSTKKIDAPLMYELISQIDKEV